MYVIGPMVLYICERLIRFIRYMQTVRYRRVSVTRRPTPPPPLPEGRPPASLTLVPRV